MAKRRDGDFSEHDLVRDFSDEDEIDEFYELEELRGRRATAIFGDEIYEEGKNLVRYRPLLTNILNQLVLETGNAERVFEVARTLASELGEVPTLVGNSLLLELPGMGSLSGNLESRLGGLLALGKVKPLQDSVVFNTVVEKLRGVRNYGSVVKAIKDVAPDIARLKKEERFSAYLEAFTLATASGATVAQLRKLLKSLVHSLYRTDVVLASNGKMLDVPQHLKKLFENDVQREKYIELITKLPSTQHLSAERFPQYMTSSSSEFFQSWIGATAEKTRVEFYDGLCQEYDLATIIDLSQSFVAALFNKGKNSRKLLRKIRDEAVPKIYVALKKYKQLRLGSLQKRIEKSEPVTLFKVIDSFIEEKRDEAKVASLKYKYSSLERQIRRKVSRRTSSWNYLGQFDEPLLDAMHLHEGDKDQMVGSMGFNVPQVNRAYQTSRLPAEMVVGLYSQGYSSIQIRNIGKRLAQSKKDTLEKLAKASDFKRFLFSLATDVGSLEQKITALEQFSAQDFQILSSSFEFGVNDPVNYVASLDDKQRSKVTGAIGESNHLLLLIKPDLYVIYDQVRSVFSASHMPRDSLDDFLCGQTPTRENLRNISVRKTVEAAVNSTLELYTSLPPEEKEKILGFSIYSYGPQEGGFVLRSLGGYDENYDDLRKTWKKETTVYFPISEVATSSIKDFVRLYGGLNSDQRSRLVKSMYELRRVKELSHLVKLAVENVHKNPTYLNTVAKLIGSVSSDEAFTLAKDERLIEVLNRIDEGYEGTLAVFAKSLKDYEKLVELPTQDFYAAAQAYDFAKQNGQEGAFFSGFKQSLNQGTVDKWAKTIVDHFRKGAIGGDMYRYLEAVV